MRELWTEHLMTRFSQFAEAANSEVLILCPFIKLHALNAIICGLEHKRLCVITRWRTADIVSKASDLEVFELLAAKGIPLMVHRQLHMKAIVRDQRELLLATANITAAGLGDRPFSNIECATVVSLQEKDQRWIAQIYHESTKVTRAQYELFREHIETQRRHVGVSTIEEFPFVVEPRNECFSVCELPTVDTPHRFLATLDARYVSRTSQDWERTMQDAKAFGIPLPLKSPERAIELLRNTFFAKPIICALMEFVATKRYFGEIKRWIRQKCHDSNTLTNAEMVRRVRTVFNWIVTLSDGRYTVRRPNFSQCLVRLKR